MNTKTELPTLLETLEMVNEYVRDKELFERRQVTFDECDMRLASDETTCIRYFGSWRTERT
jgi:hypothetical protein